MPSPYDHHWRRLRLQVLDEERWTCYLCGRPADTVDHLAPISERPDLRLVRENCRACCRSCNSGRVVNRAKAVVGASRTPAVRRKWLP